MHKTTISVDLENENMTLNGRNDPWPTDKADREGKSKRAYKGKSLLTLPEDYVVMDLETTGLDPRFDEIIEVACIRYRSHQEVGRFVSFVHPEDAISSFITDLTGITDEMVKDAPPIEDVLPRFRAFIDGDIVIGHNVDFDINFLYDTSIKLGLDPFSNDFIDTLRISRRLYREWTDHKLSTLIRNLEVGDTVEHRALSDSIQTQKCYFKMFVYADQIGGIPSSHRSSRYAGKKISAKDIIADTDAFDPDHPIFGMSFVFTGKLERMSRKETMQAVVDAGGICQDRVTSKTDFLVLGDNDYHRTLKGGKSTK